MSGRYYVLRHATPGDDARYTAEFARLRGNGLHPAIAAILAHEHVTAKAAA